MPADEFIKWENHLKYYPIPGMYEQHLLATLICLQINTKEKKYDVFDVAPWLETPEIKELRDNIKEQQQVQTLSSIYKEMKKGK